MSLRARIAIIAATAVAVAVVAASVGLYFATARTLRASVDHSLQDLVSQERDQERDEHPGPPDHGFRGGPRPGRFGGPGGFAQQVTAAGQVQGPPLPGGGERLPVGDRAVEVASGRAPAFFQTAQVDAVPLRILTVPAGPGVALQLARPLTEVENALAALRRQLALSGIAGVLLAAALGTVVARRAVRPVHDLTALAEQVAATQDLSRRIEVQRQDEIGRLARTFNGMLANLEQARHAQEQLVADASHELRTPLTSLRTNIEVLTQADLLDPEDRQRLIRDVVVQLDEFGRLVGALVELARGAKPATGTTAVRLDELVIRAVERARRDGQRIQLQTAPVVVMGEADRLERAVVNLLDNAAKYAPGGPVDVTVDDRGVRVRDHGPGVGEEHLPHLFDRFYRAPEARAAPGSGLGLSIVQQVVESHGGSVMVANAPDGGAVFTLRLPVEPSRPDDAGR